MEEINDRNQAIWLTDSCTGSLTWDYVNSITKWTTITRETLEHKVPDIDKVIFNDPATIVIWSDGTKTIVKAGKDEYFDKEKGLAMAISKKALGNKGNYFNTFKKHGAVDGDEEIYVPLSLLKECTTLKKLKTLIAFMED